MMDEDEDYYFNFIIEVDDAPAAQVYGPKSTRNLVLWRVSSYVNALSDRGDITVQRISNGEQHAEENWRQLAH